MAKLLLLINLFFLSTSISLCQNKKNIIIDADTANELDDLFAITRALIDPSLNVLAITSSQFHTSPHASNKSSNESHKINQKLIKLLNINNTKLAIGSNEPIKDTLNPFKSEASDLIIQSARRFSENKRLKILILGPCTNVASAIIHDPSIINKIEVYYVGFWHDKINNNYDKNEFNTRNDRLALDLLLNTEDLNFNVMSATTSQYLVFDKVNVFNRFKVNKDLGSYLIDRWENYDRWWNKKDTLKNKWIMWDLALVEAIINPDLALKNKFTTPSENLNRLINIFTYIDVEKMKANFWLKIERFFKSEIH